MNEQVTGFIGTDHWPISTPAAQGVSTSLLEAGFDAAARIQPFYSLLVARNGQLIGEHYYGRCTTHHAVNVHSVTKSVVSALVGIAMREGYIKSVDEPIHTWLPEYTDPQAGSSQHALTLHHLLTMSAGLGWIENAGGLKRLYHSPDWAQFALALPVIGLPGQQFNYNTTLTHLTSIILTRASGMSTLALAEQTLFAPLGIPTPRWKTDPQGIPIGGTDLYLTPRQMLSLGQLYLQHGKWGGQQIVPQEWVHTSTRDQIALNRPGFWNPAYTAYGYYWWLRQYKGYAAVVASGYAGQHIIIVPALNLVVVTTANADVPFSSVMKQVNLVESIVEDYVIPSIHEVTINGSTHNRVSK
jgi:CubicO group peptidase (beta-lactamase class C family)